MKRIKLFENFDKSVNESKAGAFRVLFLRDAIRKITGDENMHPSGAWTPKQAIEWAVGFAKTYGLWHPDDSAHDIVWDVKTPADLDKADKQMERFCEVDWSSIGKGLDQYVVAMFVTNVVNDTSLLNADGKPQASDMHNWINNPDYSAEVDALASIFEGASKDLIQYRHKAEDLFFRYDKGQIDLVELISGLRDIEDHARKNIGGDPMASLWFRFFKGDTGATTIREIEHDLNLPDSHRNNKHMREQIKGSYDLNNEIEVYYS